MSVVSTTIWKIQKILRFSPRFNNNWGGVEGLEPFSLEQLTVAFGILLGGLFLAVFGFTHEICGKKKKCVGKHGYLNCTQVHDY